MSTVKNNSIQYPLLIAALLLSCGLAAVGLLRLEVDTDVLSALPGDNRIINDALTIFHNHPMLEQVAIDVCGNDSDLTTLSAAGKFVEKQLKSSNLFVQVGFEEIGVQMPGIALDIAHSLPLLFSKQELLEQVAPRLTATAVKERMAALFADLSSMEGIGQAQFTAIDPLGLKNIVLAKMAELAPSRSARFHQGMLLSPDQHHVLITARPKSSGTDTRAARQLVALLADISAQLDEQYAGEKQITLSSVGAFRAALDNETIIRRDVNLAIFLSMAGIGLLLLFSFSRPLIGLLSLVPAIAGTGIGLFVYSLFHSSISIMVLGFGGAVISITVDHSIAFLLFMDSSRTGEQSSHEVKAVGVMAVLTTVGAFLMLCFSGFPMFIELGRFTALGVGCSFLFVHLIFARVFPSGLPGAKRVPPLQKTVNRCASLGWTGAVAACCLALFMLVNLSPTFDAGLESMNSVSRETREADELFNATWGNLEDKIYLMHRGKDIGELTIRNDLLFEKIREDIDRGLIGSAFVPSMLFPGREAALENLRDWQRFWTVERVEQLQDNLQQAALPLGFSKQAFAQFYTSLSLSWQAAPAQIKSSNFPLLGISRSDEKGDLVSFITLKPGSNYDPVIFHDRYGQFGHIYDSGYFSDRVGSLLFTTFTRMLLIIGVSITLFLLFFFLSIRLTCITLVPVLFAYICTLGTLNLLGRSLDIPALMLSIVILGMGIDYSIFFVRAHQRYREASHPGFALVRMAVFMAAGSTLIGFGVLAGAEHSMLQSIGITCLLGIGYSLLGSFLLLPPLLERVFSAAGQPDSNESMANIRCRYHLMEAYPRMFARNKLRFDPMFSELPQVISKTEGERATIHTILDVGCGYGVPAAWCLEYFSKAVISGIDPDSERVRVAAMVVGSRGNIVQGWAPDLPQNDQPTDLILLLDMVHYLDEATIKLLLHNCFQAAGDGAELIIRYTVQPAGKHSLLWHLETLRNRINEVNTTFRTPLEMEALLNRAGFTVEMNEVTTNNPELFWLKGRVVKKRP